MNKLFESNEITGRAQQAFEKRVEPIEKGSEVYPKFKTNSRRV
jgi:hypothetical protein